MMGVLMPEIILHDTLVKIVKLLRMDLQDHVNDDQNTILYKLFGVDENGDRIKLNLIDYFKQAKKIIQTQQNLSVNFGYNQEVAKMISLHIILPSEQAKSTIGEDEGYMEEEIEDNEVVIGRQMYFTQTYNSTYQILISSNNSLEVNIVYTILKSMLLMLVPHLELSGLRNPTMSGNDIVMQEDLTPVPIFHKVLNLTFEYEHNVPQLFFEEIMKKFNVQSTMYSANMEDYNEQV